MAPQPNREEAMRPNTSSESLVSYQTCPANPLRSLAIAAAVRVLSATRSLS